MTTNLKTLLEEILGIKDLNLEFSSHEEHGDLATNIALILAKKENKNPKEIAEEIVNKLQKDQKLNAIIEKIEVAGPGFINFWLSKEFLLKELKETLTKKDEYGSSKEGKGKTVVVDYSAPNIAKRFSIGHLRSTIIGQALYNLYSFKGFKVVGDNHLGDWGTQFGVLIYMVEKKKLDPSKLKVEDWEKLYVQFHKGLESNPDLKDEARNAFKRLEGSDPKARSIWKAALETSLKEYQKIYDLLNVKIDYTYGESFYEDKMSEVIDEAKKKGLAKKGERGALIIEIPGLPPAMLVKSDGTTTYFTRDLATVRYRIKTWNPNVFIYEVGSDQILHFRQLFKVVKMLGWVKDQEMIHVAHGLVRFKEGKMSTRRGQTVKLEEVLNLTIEKAKKFNSDSKIAQIVGIGAMKYFDLMHEPKSDIIFDWNKIFLLEGNSAPYLQYTFARTQSVLDKSNKKTFKVEGFDLASEETLVLRTLSRFPEVISITTQTYSPNILCEYLFQLAQKYNNFYNTNRIIGSSNEDLRLSLTKGVGQVIKNGLNLLGIEAPKRM